MGRDFFVRMDYIPDSVVNNGFQGRQIFGAPVYMTNNLPAVNTNYHAPTYFHREAHALVTQIAPKVMMERWAERIAWGITCIALYGVKTMREPFGVWIKSRS